MAGPTVFFSWQSDSPRKANRDLIHDAAADAISRIASGLRLDDAPRLDHDTLGVAGVPGIGETILGKIDRCGVFLADVSLVGRTTRTDKPAKLMPNSNILIELGYAAARIGWERLILVVNTAFGPVDALPFDLKFRRFPLAYIVGDDRSELEAQQARLSTDIELALLTALSAEHELVFNVLRKLDGITRRLMVKHATAAAFWETDIQDHQLPGHRDLSIRRLLELEIIECGPIVREDTKHAYTWTYLGRLCLKALGLPQVEQPNVDSAEVASPNVLVDLIPLAGSSAAIRIVNHPSAGWQCHCGQVRASRWPCSHVRAVACSGSEANPALAVGNIGSLHPCERLFLDGRLRVCRVRTFCDLSDNAGPRASPPRLVRKPI